MQFGKQTVAEPIVTVVMPVLAASHSFVYALRSLLLQTFTSFELLLPTSVDLEENDYEGLLGDPRVVVWREEKKRTMAARLNGCIERARGKYFAEMMPDDMSYPSRLQAQIDFLSFNPEIDVVGTQMLAFRNSSVPVGKISAPIDHHQLTMASQLGIKLFDGTWAGKTSWFLRHRFEDRCAAGEHQEFLSRTMAQSQFAVLPRIYYASRQHERTLASLLHTSRVNLLQGSTSVHTRALNALPLAGKLFFHTAASVIGLRDRAERRPVTVLSAAEIEEWMKLRELLLYRSIGPVEEQPVMMAARGTSSLHRAVSCGTAQTSAMIGGGVCRQP